MGYPKGYPRGTSKTLYYITNHLSSWQKYVKYRRFLPNPITFKKNQKNQSEGKKPGPLSKAGCSLTAGRRNKEKTNHQARQEAPAAMHRGPEGFTETRYVLWASRQIKSSIFWQVERLFQRGAFVWLSPYIALAGVELLIGIQRFADFLGYYALFFCGFNRPPAKTIE